MRNEILNRRVGRQLPPVAVLAKPVRIIQIHLDEVLVEAVGSAAPSSIRIYKLPGLQVDISPQQPRERLTQRRLRPQEVGLGLLCETCVFLITGQVAQAGPFQHQRADGGEAVCVGASLAGRVEPEVVVGDAAGGVEGDFEVVGEPLCLVEDGTYSGWLGDVFF